MSTNLFPSNEIVGAMAGSMASAEDLAIFAKDPKAVLSSQLNIQTEADFNVVENSNEEIHLALPYYTIVEQIQAEMLADDSIEDVAGGEIVVGLTLIAIGLGTGSITAAIAGTIVVGTAVGLAAVAATSVGITKTMKKDSK